GGKTFPSLRASYANGGRRSPLCARRAQTGEGVPLSARGVCKRGKTFPSLRTACANGGTRSPLCARRVQTGEGVPLSAHGVCKRGNAFPSLRTAYANGGRRFLNLFTARQTAPTVRQLQLFELSPTLNCNRLDVSECGRWHV